MIIRIKNFPLTGTISDLKEMFESIEILVAFSRNFDIRESWGFLPVLPRGINKHSLIIVFASDKTPLL